MCSISSDAERPRPAAARAIVERLLIAPHNGPGVCRCCLNLTGGEGLCWACRHGEQRLAVAAPISYSVGGEELHRLIVAYKREADSSVPAAVTAIAQLYDRFLTGHEPCIARAAGLADRFDLVTTVPSADPLRDLHHPLRRIAGELCEVTRERYERLLVRSDSVAIPRVYDPARYAPTRLLADESVLLIDDMWTSGASAQSAAGALLSAGARCVAAVVLARHLNRSWQDNDVRLRRLQQLGFGYERCVLCAQTGTALPPDPRRQRRPLA
jgi:hypothetical protein